MKDFLISCNMFLTAHIGAQCIRTQLTLLAICASAAILGCGDGSLKESTAQNLEGAGVDSTRRTMAAASSNDSQPVSVTGLTKFAERRISRTVYEYTFKVSVKNGGSLPVTNVSVFMTGAGGGTTIIDGNVMIGELSANATFTGDTDTVTVRHDRNFVFDQSAIRWQINSTPITSPSIYDGLDRTSSVSGVDHDQNGIRDDVDNVILKSAISDNERRSATRFAKAIQSLIVAPEITGNNAVVLLSEHLAAMKCLHQVGGNSRIIYRNLMASTLNTRVRLQAFLRFEQLPEFPSLLNTTGECQ